MEYFLKKVYFVLTKGNVFTIVCVLFLLQKLKFLLWSAFDQLWQVILFETFLRISKSFIYTIKLSPHLAQMKLVTLQGRWSALGHSFSRLVLYVVAKCYPWLALWVKVYVELRVLIDIGMLDRLTVPFKSCFDRNSHNNTPMSIGQSVRPKHVPMPNTSHVWV